MPGIILIYNKKQNSGNINICNDIAKKMYACNEFQATDLNPDNTVQLKLLTRNNRDSGIHEFNKGLFAWVGRPFYKGRLLDKGSFNIIEDALCQKGINALLNHLSGHFQLVIYFKESKKCYIICDKISTHPVYYVETDAFITFSPEPLAFTALGKHNWRPSIRTESVFEFMASGYLWGDGCFLNEIKRLGPGQYICLEQDGMKISSYWKMTFVPDKKTDQSLTTELFEAIQKGIYNLPKGRKILTLSGGYDSRALLGFLNTRGEQLNTVSYSFGSKENKGMDIDVGAYYADKAGISHSHFVSSTDEPSRLMSDINSAIEATGGENYLSIFQDAFLGTDFYRNLAKSYDYMLRGDEVWGWGDLPANYDMAFWESRLFNLNEILHPKKIMKPDILNSGIKYIERKRQGFIEECGDPDISANDLKDYLYWRHREARLLQNMAYFRRCYIPHFAPFLFDRTLSVIRRTPSRLRIQKRLFMKMGKEMFPKLFADNKAISPHSSDVNNFSFIYKNKKYRSFIRGALLESGAHVFNNIFDRKLLEPWIDNILNNTSADIGKLRKKHDLKRLTISFIEKSDHIKAYMKAAMVKKGMNTFPVLSANYLFRLVALSLALQKYDNNA